MELSRHEWFMKEGASHFSVPVGPEMVSWFQSIIGFEAREQMLAQTGRLPDRVYACVGGGSNAMGIFQAFFDDDNVELIVLIP